MNCSATWGLTVASAFPLQQWLFLGGGGIARVVEPSAGLGGSCWGWNRSWVREAWVLFGVAAARTLPRAAGSLGCSLRDWTSTGSCASGGGRSEDNARVKVCMVFWALPCGRYLVIPCPGPRGEGRRSGFLPLVFAPLSPRWLPWHSHTTAVTQGVLIHGLARMLGGSGGSPSPQGAAGGVLAPTAGGDSGGSGCCRQEG